MHATVPDNPILTCDWECENEPIVFHPQARMSASGVDWVACVHRGESIRTEVCATCCGGGVKVKVFACSEFGECTIGKQIGALAVCVGCGSFSEVNAASREAI